MSMIKPELGFLQVQLELVLPDPAKLDQPCVSRLQKRSTHWELMDAYAGLPHHPVAFILSVLALLVAGQTQAEVIRLR